MSHRRGQHWIELHASEILVENTPENQMELLRFLATDKDTFDRLRDALVLRAVAVIDTFREAKFEKMPFRSELHQKS